MYLLSPLHSSDWCSSPDHAVLLLKDGERRMIHLFEQKNFKVREVKLQLVELLYVGKSASNIYFSIVR